MTPKYQRISIDKVKIGSPYYLSNPQAKKYADSPSMIPAVFYARRSDKYICRKVWTLPEHLEPSKESFL